MMWIDITLPPCCCPVHVHLESRAVYIRVCWSQSPWTPRDLLRTTRVSALLTTSILYTRAAMVPSTVVFRVALYIDRSLIA